MSRRRGGLVWAAVALAWSVAACGQPASSGTSAAVGSEPSAVGTASSAAAADRQGAGSPGPSEPPSTVAPTTTTTTPPPPWPAGASASAGCASPAALPAGETRWELGVAGVARTYVLRVVGAPDQRVPVPVLVVLHGLGSDGATILDYVDPDAVAVELGAIVVAPEAVGADHRWVDSDVGVIAAMLDSLEAMHCLDRNRVWLTGLSMGGFMTARLLCGLPGRFAAAATVAGFGYDPLGCPGAPPTPLLSVHGTADHVIPFEGRPPSYTSVMPSRGAMAAAWDWAAHNRCTAGPVEERLGSEVVRRTWQGCAAETATYVVEGGGHSWPGAVPYESQGHTTAQVSATALAGELFARSVRAGPG